MVIWNFGILLFDVDFHRLRSQWVHFSAQASGVHRVSVLNYRSNVARQLLSLEIQSFPTDPTKLVEEILFSHKRFDSPSTLFR